MVRPRVRIRFSKEGDLRLVGHRDLMRAFERLFRRAGLPLGMSEGFHPKPRMTFPLALAVGIEGRDEVMELELSEEAAADALLAQLRPQSPPGLGIVSAEVLPLGSRKAAVRSACYEMRLPSASCEGLQQRLDHLMGQASFPIRRPATTKTIDLRQSLHSLTLREGVLQFQLRTDPGCAGPRDVLAALGLETIENEGVHLTRTALEINT